MMKKINYPRREQWSTIAERPMIDLKEMNQLVSQVFQETQKKGDEALQKYTELFDGVRLDDFQVKSSQIIEAENEVPENLKEAIQLAFQNIEKFHASQKEKTQVVETSKGVKCWRESRPINPVGIYVPGGSAPLFSTVLMLGVPAKLAGCKEIILCTPPDSNGKIHPAILYCAKLVGIEKVFRLGGIQAIAALTIGTESVPKVAKIFGPGNQYVTAAKQYAQQRGVAIDFPAGPSELLVISDQESTPAFVAADLLSQAEHGPDSQVILLSNDQVKTKLITEEVERQIKLLPRRSIAEKAIQNSKAVVFETLEECVEFSNFYAPEHLILALEKPNEYASAIESAGSVFLGKYSCESAGDYASGTNHTLPTSGFAGCYSGVSLDSFIKKITFQEITKEGIQHIGPAIELMAEAEGLDGHKNAVSIRLK